MDDTSGQFAGFNPPIHTQTPNELFDVLLSQIDGIAELKVLLFAIRKTLGWHQSTDYISVTQFEQGTGLSRRGVCNGIEACLKRGTLLRAGEGKRGVCAYQLRLCGELVKEVDQSTKFTSEASSIVKTPTSEVSRPELVKQVDTQKKPTKERELKKGEADVAQAPPQRSRAQQFVLSQFEMQRFGKKAQSEKVDNIAARYGMPALERAAIWLSEKGRALDVHALETTARKIALDGERQQNAPPRPPSGNGRGQTMAEKFAIVDEAIDHLATGGSYFGNGAHAGHREGAAGSLPEGAG